MTPWGGGCADTAAQEEAEHEKAVAFAAAYCRTYITLFRAGEGGQMRVTKDVVA